MRDQRIFPIHPSDRGYEASVPWGLVEPYGKRAILNHSQSLETLASRGGLGIVELYYLLHDSPFERPLISHDNALSYLRTRLALFRGTAA